jgi:hypothetical protein
MNPEDTVTIRLSRKDAEAISHGLSDLLCWARGFCAGNPDSSHLPLGIDAGRRMNIKLKDAINDH